jgi:hypothetical protein
MIRDRTMSLAMRCPLQINTGEFDLNQQPLTIHDMEDETHKSEVYSFDEKVALCHVLTSLCHFVVAVTDLCSIAYPPLQALPSSNLDFQTELHKLEEAKTALLLWEVDWMADIKESSFYPHPSVPMFTRLNAMYY